jgi:hypothetical protein
VCAADGRRRGVTRRRTDDGAAAVRARGQGPRVGRRAQLPRRRGWLGRRSTEEVVGGQAERGPYGPGGDTADLGRGRPWTRQTDGAAGDKRGGADAAGVRVRGPAWCMPPNPPCSSGRWTAWTAAGGGRRGRVGRTARQPRGAHPFGVHQAAWAQQRGVEHAITWRSRGDRTAGTWRARGEHVVSSGEHAVSTWRAHGEHVASTW